VVWHRPRRSSHPARWRDTNEDAAEIMFGVLVNGWEECRGQHLMLPEAPSKALRTHALPGLIAIDVFFSQFITCNSF
jgi:hypothetical protein